jgi:hypothetical protein
VTPDQLIAHAAPKIAALGAGFYFDPKTLAVGKERGLDGFRFYFLGRGGVLGDVEPLVVTSAFGYFNPAVVEKMWTTGSQKLAPKEAATIYLECCAQWGRERLGGVDGLGQFCQSAEAIAAAGDPAGLTLFAGIKAQPLADDEVGRAAQLIAVLREFRGSAHLVAVLASGLTAELAHYIKRPNDYASFGWGDTAPEVTDDDRGKLTAAEAMTDRLVRPAFAVLDAGQADAFAATLDQIEAAAGL